MRHRAFRSLAMLVPLVLAFSAFAPAGYLTSLAQDPDINLWENETYDFTIGWTDEWAVDAAEIASVAPGGDVLMLTSGDANLTLRGEPADLSPAERLEQELNGVTYLNGTESETIEDSDSTATAEWRSDTISRLVSVTELESGEGILVITLVAETTAFDDAIASAAENVTVDDSSLLGDKSDEPVPTVEPDDPEPTEESEDPDPTEEADDREPTREADDPEPTEESGSTDDLKLPTQEPLGDGVDGNTYTSPNFGYSFEWDDSEWEVVEDGEVSEGGYDLLTLTGTYGGLSIYAFEDYGGEADTCLEGEIAYNETDPSIEDWEPATNSDGDPIAGETDDTAYAVYTATLLDPDNENALGRDVVAYLECRSIGDGVILGISAFSLENLYNDHIDAVIELTDTITLYDDSDSGDDRDSDNDRESERPESPTDDEAEEPESPSNDESEDSEDLEVPDDEERGESSSSPEEDEPSDDSGDEAVEGSLYSSPGFGFTVDIPATWTIEDEIVDENDEQLILSNGTSTVTVWATTEFGDGTLADCVSFIAESSELELELDIRADGGPFSGSDDLSAYGAFVYDNDGTEFTYFIKCVWIEEDESVLLVIQDVATEDYASERRARRQIENSIDLP